MSTGVDAATLFMGKNPITGESVGGFGRVVAAVGLLTPASGREIRAAGKAISFAKHYFDQKFARAVRSADIWEAFKKPLQVKPVKVDELGRPSQQIIGPKATVVQNPETGQVINVWPTSSKRAEKLQNQPNQQ